MMISMISMISMFRMIRMFSMIRMIVIPSGYLTVRHGKSPFYT